MVCDEVPEKQSQIRDLEVASHSLATPRHPDHRREILNLVQRLLVRFQEYPYALLGLFSRLLLLLLLLLLGCPPLRARVLLESLWAGRLRLLIGVRRALGGI